MQNQFVQWDDIFNADYTDIRLREMITVSQAIKQYEEQPTRTDL